MSDAFNTIFNNWLVAAIVMMGLASIVSSVAKEFRKFICHRQDLEFKREMVDRGVPVEDVQRLVRARSKPAKTEE